MPVEQVSVSSAAWLKDDFHGMITGNGTVHKGILAFYVSGSILQEFILKKEASEGDCSVSFPVIFFLIFSKKALPQRGLAS